MGKGNQEVQTSRYKLSKSWEYNIHHEEYSQQNY